MSQNQQLGPVVGQGRYLILDALRGFSLMGIILANLPEFALWTFLSADQQAQMLILGYLAGKHQLYARISTLPLKKMLWWFGLH